MQKTQNREMNNTNRLSKKEIQKLNKSSQHEGQFYEDIPYLTSQSPQVISRQATLNIGAIGHVSHGKSTVVKAITGVNPIKFREEMKNNYTTMKLGYANAKIYKCPTCPAPSCYKSYSSGQADSPACPNEGCTSAMNLIRHVSFCDCPGHDRYMSTMLTGAAVMDAAMLVVSAADYCPQPQTAEHVAAMQFLQMENIIVVQNKVDVAKTKQNILRSYKQIKQFVKDTVCAKAPIIPICASEEYNIDAVLQSICQIPAPNRKFDAPPQMIIVRSFDVNKPGDSIDKLKGGVVGGTLTQGVLEVGMDVQIRPGILTNSNGTIICQPIKTRIVSLQSQKNKMLYAVPGGLIGVGLLVDPSLTTKNKMVGNILGKVGTLPQIYTEITIKFYKMNYLLGSKSSKQDKGEKVKNISVSERLKLKILSTQTIGQVYHVAEDIMQVKLVNPICADLDEKVAFSRKFQSKYRLIGYGVIKSGKCYQKQ